MITQRNSQGARELGYHLPVKPSLSPPTCSLNLPLYPTGCVKKAISEPDRSGPDVSPYVRKLTGSLKKPSLFLREENPDEDEGPSPTPGSLAENAAPTRPGSSFSTDLAQTLHLSNSCSRAKNEAETFKPDSKGAQVSEGKSNMRPEKGLRKPRSPAFSRAGRAGRGQEGVSYSPPP